MQSPAFFLTCRPGEDRKRWTKSGLLKLEGGGRGSIQILCGEEGYRFGSERRIQDTVRTTVLL